MSEARWHLIAYDVSDDKRRRRAERLLLGNGDRVQYSIFKVQSTPRNLMRLRWELAKVLDSSDRLMVIPLSDAIARSIPTVEGRMEPEAPADRAYRIVG